MRAVAVAAASAMVLLAGQFGSASADNSGSLDRLVGLLADRLDTADTVAAAKWATAARDGSEPVIDDPAREAQIGDAMARLGTDRGLPEAWVRQIFQGQIDANKIVQRGLITEWRYVQNAPIPAMDLATVRPVIDRLNTEIIDELAGARGELASQDCTAQLTGSVLTTSGTHHSDPLHQAALVRAAISLCGA